jgi:hypothetical protein
MIIRCSLQIGIVSKVLVNFKICILQLTTGD